MHHSSVMSLSKNSSWFYSYLHIYKQIICFGHPKVHIFHRTLGPLCIKIDNESLSYIYIYMCVCVCVCVCVLLRK